MGALIQDRKNKDSIQIVTDAIESNGAGGVRKRSEVKVKGAVAQTFSLGMKIRADQSIVALSFDGNSILGRYDQAVTDACTVAFPPSAGEQWKGFKVLTADLPNPGQFKTRFELDHPPAAGRYQLVDIVAAEDPKRFGTGAYLVAVSIVTPPDGGPLELRRG
jgi:hypothetical protein